MTLTGWGDRVVVPVLIDLACGSVQMHRLQEQVAPQASDEPLKTCSRTGRQRAQSALPRPHAGARDRRCRAFAAHASAGAVAAGGCRLDRDLGAPLRGGGFRTWIRQLHLSGLRIVGYHYWGEAIADKAAAPARSG